MSKYSAKKLVAYVRKALETKLFSRDPKSSPNINRCPKINKAIKNYGKICLPKIDFNFNYPVWEKLKQYSQTGN
ncbi:hypothetical protein GcC1_044026 [Golovinomyces cichoracearum]|uniref:Uncharacterized protein n=1 Tax=Golovinomyces cichoracearum TaxID=62708 RepID=A0A420IYR1_9PEZI|nr:hypothetical protein GcC1_044026 [Golovinomyces cichoracearum]